VPSANVAVSVVSRAASTTGSTATPGVSATPTPGPTPQRPRGVDLSHWNGSISFSAMRDFGIRFAFLKATQGTYMVDKTYATNTAAGASAGVLTGAYHFFDYRMDGVKQADWFVDSVLARDGFAGKLPPVVDVECLEALGGSNPAYAASQLRSLLAQVYRRTGRSAVIYTSRHMWGRVVGGDATFGTYPLWVACWGCSSPILPTGWRTWSYWQDGDVAIPALGKTIDHNVFNGTAETLPHQLTGPHLVDGGAAFTNSRTVSVGLRGSDGCRGGLPARWRAVVPRGSRTPRSVPTSSHPTDGPQRVSVRFKDRDGNLSPAFGDSITLDTTAPVANVTIAGGDAVTTDPVVDLSIDASDATSGVAQLRLSDDGTTWTGWEPFSAARTWTLSGSSGPRTVHVQVVDVAGNVVTVSDTISLGSADTGPSVPTDLAASDVGETGAALHWSASSDDQGVAHYRVYLGTTPLGEPTDPTWAATGLEPGRSYTFSMTAVDTAGNESAPGTLTPDDRRPDAADRTHEPPRREPDGDLGHADVDSLGRHWRRRRLPHRSRRAAPGRHVRPDVRRHRPHAGRQVARLRPRGRRDRQHRPAATVWVVTES
jgi:GH25 family lysozyme M1 (1,4-beta-N-acetylmuramidase)